MTVFMVNEATGLGAGDLAPGRVLLDLVAIANETSVGFAAEAAGMQQVTYTTTLTGPTQTRLNNLVNTVFNPDYGAGPQQVDILIVSAPDGFVFDDGTLSTVDNGVALPPNGSGLAGDTLNPTVNCVVLYDSSIEICLVSQGSGGATDLSVPSPIALYHELSHAFRIVTNALLAVTGVCNPSSPEESAAIQDENDMRNQWATMMGETAVLRDPGNHCAGTCGGAGGGGCCIVASLVSGSARSPQVQRLRAVRDGFLRRTELGFSFFERLHYSYYSFSPQVCRLIAGDPALGAAVLHGYVEPLIDFWSLMVERAGTADTSDAKLAQMFERHARSLPDVEARLAALERTREFWDGGAASDAALPQELLQLLRERAWSSEHVHWALTQPVVQYWRALSQFASGLRALELGRSLRAGLDEWTYHFPIEPFWGTLSAAQARAELALCEDQLLRSRCARRRFRARLAAHFRGVTAVEQVCAEALEGGS